MLKEITEWTKEDFEAFDAQRAAVFQLTPAEIDAMRQQQRAEVRDHSLAILASYGITIPDTVSLDEAIAILDSIGARQYIGDEIERILLQQGENQPQETIADAFYDVVARSIPYNATQWQN